MFLKKCLPKNSSLRFRFVLNTKNLFLKKFKKLFINLKKKNGKNYTGHITIRHKGGGLFNFRRIVDFYRIYNNLNNFLAYDIDKKYSCFLGLIKYNNGCYKYILVPDQIKVLENIRTTFHKSLNIEGNTLPIGWIKNGTVCFNLENKPKLGGNISRSAGTYCKIISHEENQVTVLLPSKKKKKFSPYCLATIGRASNILFFLKKLGKAGINRIFNIRPTVRGEVMNPIDHPNGGRTRGGKPRKNPWGKIIK